MTYNYYMADYTFDLFSSVASSFRRILIYRNFQSSCTVWFVTINEVWPGN